MDTREHWIGVTKLPLPPAEFWSGKEDDKLRYRLDPENNELIVEKLKPEPRDVRNECTAEIIEASDKFSSYISIKHNGIEVAMAGPDGMTITEDGTKHGYRLVADSRSRLKFRLMLD